MDAGCELEVIDEFGDKVAMPEKKAIEDAMEDLRKVKDEDDIQATNAKIEILTQASMKLGEAMYKASQEEPVADAAEGGAQPQGDESPEVAEGEVVDADFEEVDPEKKDD